MKGFPSFLKEKNKLLSKMSFKCLRKNDLLREISVFLRKNQPVILSKLKIIKMSKGIYHFTEKSLISDKDSKESTLNQDLVKV